MKWGEYYIDITIQWFCGYLLIFPHEKKKVTNAMIHDHLTVKKKTLIEKDKGQRLGGYAT